MERDTDFTKALVDDVNCMKIGIPRSYFGDGLDADLTFINHKSMCDFFGYTFIYKTKFTLIDDVK